MHILGHVLGIPAHVEVALLAAQKLCQLSAISPHVHLCHTTSAEAYNRAAQGAQQD